MNSIIRFSLVAVTLLGIACGGKNGSQGGVGGVAVTTHPRLFITGDDVMKLRARATSANPLWAKGLAPLLDAKSKAAAAAMQSGSGDPFTTTGCGDYGEDACEAYAELFAFGALVHPDADTRAQLKNLAHWLVMQVVNEYLGGMMGSEATDFATGDRSRWNGESLPLAVDWIYDAFSDDEKSRIHDAFVMHCDALSTMGYHHPDPTLSNDDAALIADRVTVRWSGNNYWTAEMRDIGLMAMALDDSDDGDGKLAAAFLHATKGYLFVFDNLTRNECAGGLCGEGPEYAPQTLSYAAQLMLALRTAGRNDPTKYGPQVVRENNPFWSDLVQAWAAWQSPSTFDFTDGTGIVHQPAWNGDGYRFYAQDAIAVLGTLALDARAAGDTTLGDAAAFIANADSPSDGGALADRIAKPTSFADALMYFLVFDGTTMPADPRPAYPTRTFAPGMGEILARTDWTTNASFFEWHVGWQSIDHQHADANDFALFRNGEWLTKETTGYQNTNTDVLRTDGHNGVAVQNDGPTVHSDWRLELWTNGSQFPYVGDGDPAVLTHAFDDHFVYAEGDATKTYNSMYESTASTMIEDVKHVSRAIVWLPPASTGGGATDRVVVYDRVETGADGHFKRVWFHYPSVPTQAASNRVIATTAKGQQVAVTVLLPAQAMITAAAWKPTDEANYDTMSARSVTEATTASARFLHVAEGLDAGATPSATSAIASMSGPAVDGVIVGDTAVSFAHDVGALTATFSFRATGAQHVLVTGLTSGANYDVSRTGDVVTVTPGGSQTATDGALYIP
jgi:hypothetical protein